MSHRIVCVGECMVELAPAGPGLLRQGFAGDTFNTAWYLRRQIPAGWTVDYLSAVGRDAISDAMLRFMADAGIGTRHVAQIEGATVGLYLITVQEGERSFSYWRGQSAARALANDPARLRAGLAGAALVVFSGITLAILAPPARATLLASLRAAQAEGATLAFDPNMRPRLWPDAATMRTAIREAAALADIMLPSFDEEQATFADTSPETTLARYRHLGARIVVVKNGAGPMLGWNGALHRHQPPAIAPLDTTAAGDSFNAGFLAAHLAGAPLPDAMAQGARLAGQVILHPGALVAI